MFGWKRRYKELKRASDQLIEANKTILEENRKLIEILLKNENIGLEELMEVQTQLTIDYCKLLELTNE